MVRRQARVALLAAFVFMLAAAAVVGAQEFRGSITGVVADQSGGVLPGVTVTIKNLDTAVLQTVVTDENGLYRVMYLNPGRYEVSAELQGFKKFVSTSNQVGVGDVVRVDVVLQAGGIEEVVSVVADAPLLNSASGISGTTISTKQIAELPLGDGTAYMLSRLAPGIVDSSDLHFARPMDNGNLAGIVANGATGGNQFTIDGAPNMSNARGVGFSPPSGAISEFRVQTNAFDAQTGHTAGAVVNLALKSGTNAFNGEGAWFNRDDSRSSTPLLAKRAGATKPTREYNRQTATVGGPIVRNRTFFMGSFEHLRDVQPEPATYTVPTEKMRNGDFTEFANLVYDPFTVTPAGSRSPFPGNVIPADRINPVAKAYTGYYPAPNQAGSGNGTVGNYFTNQLRPYDYNAVLGRVDHNFGQGTSLYVSTYWNKRREDRYNWAQDAPNATGDGEINGFAVTKGFDYRTNTGLTMGFTRTFSPTTLMDVKGSWARFGEWRDPASDFDPSLLGFHASALQAMSGYRYLPLMTFAGFNAGTNANSTIASLGAQRSDYGGGFDRPVDTYSVQPTLTKIWGAHTARAGYDFRRQIWTIVSSGYPGGRYQFNGAYTRATNAAATNDRAQAWAQFLLGLPTAATGAVATPGTQSSQFEIASEGEFSHTLHGLFIQDDWRVSRKLTVNAGLRLEINTGMTEAQDRNLAGYDFATPNPIEPAAQAAYAQNPIPEIPVSAFHATGGLLFADGPVNETKTKFLPRLAASYLVNERTVLRGGVGLFSYDYFFENINQAGFSQATPVLATTDNGLTFTGVTLSNPLPSGQLIQPVGAANGLASQLGQNLGTIYQPERGSPYYTRWETSLQRDFVNGWVISLTYIGSRGRNLPVTPNINSIPIQYMSTTRSRDFANESYLSQNVRNPFAGLLPGSTINGTNVQRQQLLRPYPHFGGTFAVEVYDGSDSYDAGTVQLQKRFSNGNSISSQYTYSQMRDKLNYLNPADGILEDRVAPNDRPHRFSAGTVMRLPFGKNEKWGKDWNAVLDGVLGGWQLSATYQYQSGAPLAWGNLYYDSACGDPKDLVSNIGAKVAGGIAGLDVPGWNLSCFYFHDALVQTGGADNPDLQRADQRIAMGNTLRYFPSTLPSVRTDDLHLFDLGLTKNFRLPHGMRLQVRMEAINALNYTVLWNPNVTPSNANFGFISQDRNNPRDIQLGLRLTF